MLQVDQKLLLTWENVTIKLIKNMKKKLISLYNHLRCNWNVLLDKLSFNVDKCAYDECKCKID